MAIELPIHTRIYPQNSKGGILLCGINHGYSENDKNLDESGVNREDPYKSFFSDKEVNDYPFRNNIVKWFSLWGYKLGDSIEGIGDFEKSIVQTNWLQTCSNNMSGINTHQACIQDNELFLETCEQLKPKILILFSKELLWAFNSHELNEKVGSIFGKKINGTDWLQKDIISNGKKCTRFKVGFQQYERLNVISLPHATSARGLSDDYIASFKPEISKIISDWWCQHQKANKSKHADL